MKFLNNKIFIFFSVGLNIGFIIFIAYSFYTRPLRGFERSLKTAEYALEKIDANEQLRKNVYGEIHKFQDKMRGYYKDVHGKRLEILYEYSKEKRDTSKIESLRKDIKKSLAEKDVFVSTHLNTIDNILGDKAHIYFSVVYNDVKSFLEKKNP